MDQLATIDEARRFKGAKLLTLFAEAQGVRSRYRARVPMMGRLVIVAVLVIGSTANSEPIHLGVQGLRSLIEHLQRWIGRYKAAWDYADAREQRRPISEIEWNGEMIGGLRRRSSDA